MAKRPSPLPRWKLVILLSKERSNDWQNYGPASRKICHAPLVFESWYWFSLKIQAKGWVWRRVTKVVKNWCTLMYWELGYDYVMCFKRLCCELECSNLVGIIRFTNSRIICWIGIHLDLTEFSWGTPRSSPFSALDGNEQLLCAAGGLLRFLEQNGTLLGDLQGRWGPRVQERHLWLDSTGFMDSLLIYLCWKRAWHIERTCLFLGGHCHLLARWRGICWCADYDCSSDLPGLSGWLCLKYNSILSLSIFVKATSFVHFCGLNVAFTVTLAQKQNVLFALESLSMP